MELNDFLFKQLIDLFLVEFNYDTNDVNDASIYSHIDLNDNNTFLSNHQ